METRDKIAEINNNITKAAIASGRKREDITLIAVSKTHGVEKIEEIKSYGLNIFGENKVQELIQKYPYIKDAKWHMIGHLQKNKVKYICDKVEMIHSLDNFELAVEIDKRCSKLGRIMPVLVQINIGREDSKGGILEEDLDGFIDSIKDLKFIKVSGLMAIPPASLNLEDSRVYFRKMKKLYDGLKEMELNNIDIKYLSMGMSNDYQVALEEGANIVRIGTAIFGERIYKED